MPRREWLGRIDDIINAAEKIITHTKDIEYEDFLNDEWLIDGVLYNITVIGEAARTVPEDFIERYPQVPWVDMQDMRNIIIHQYFGVDYSIVWKTIQEDLPELIVNLKMVKTDQSTGKKS